MILGRRGFIAGLAGLIAAPAVVRAESLMPVKVIAPPSLTIIEPQWFAMFGVDVFGTPMQEIVDIGPELQRGDAVIRVQPQKAFAHVHGFARNELMCVTKEERPPRQVADYAGLPHKVADPVYFISLRKDFP